MLFPDRAKGLPVEFGSILQRPGTARDHLQQLARTPMFDQRFGSERGTLKHPPVA
jgi:hypothetical protein